MQNYCKSNVRCLLWDERRGDKRNRRRQDVKERWKNNGGGGGGRATEEQQTAETMKRRAMWRGQRSREVEGVKGKLHSRESTNILYSTGRRGKSYLEKWRLQEESAETQIKIVIVISYVLCRETPQETFCFFTSNRTPKCEQKPENTLLWSSHQFILFYKYQVTKEKKSQRSVSSVFLQLNLGGSRPEWIYSSSSWFWVHPGSLPSGKCLESLEWGSGHHDQMLS